LNTSWWVP